MSNPFQDPSVTAAMSSTQPTPTANTAVPTAQAASMTSNYSPSQPEHRNGTPNTIHSSPYQQNEEQMAKNQNLVEEIGSSIKSTDASRILQTMRALNIVLACGTIAAGVLSWVFGFASSFQKVVASIYIVVFGLLLLGFELRNERLDKKIQANFGFMYGYRTRTIFLIFIAIWPLSMGNHWITILNAILLFLNAFFNFYVIYQHPAFSSPAPTYTPPVPVTNYKP